MQASVAAFISSTRGRDEANQAAKRQFAGDRGAYICVCARCDVSLKVSSNQRWISLIFFGLKLE